MRKITGSDIVRPIAETQEWFVATPAVALLKDSQVTSALGRKMGPNGESKEMLTFEKSVFASKEQ